MFARTKRLTLRPGWPEDAAALTAAIAHESVVTMLSRPPWPYGIEDAEAFLAIPRLPTDASFLILSHDWAEPRVIGGIGVRHERGMHEMGYWLTPDAWGKGYATEAGHAVLHAARHALGLKRIFARHFEDNPASGAVLRKLGFQQVGRSTLHSVARGGVVDCIEHVRNLDHVRDAAVPLAA